MANQLLDQFDLNTKKEEVTVSQNTGNSLLDQFNNSGGNYTSTTEEPKKKGIYVGGTEDRAGYIASMGAGVLSGAEKAVEGLVTTGTLLADLGLGTELTKKVENWFDSQEIFNQLEDVADDTWLGKTTEILVQLGVPGGFALKGANALLKAKNLGILNKSPNLAKFGAAGLADAAASTKDIGTIGDFIGAGPTEQRKSQGEEGRSEAFRRLTNKFKFGMEGALGFSLFDKVLIPGATKAFKSVIPTVKGVIRSAKGPGANIIRKEMDPRYEAYLKVKNEVDAIKTKGKKDGSLNVKDVEDLKVAKNKMDNLIKQGADKMSEPINVTQQLEPGWAFSENNILRKFQEVIGSKLTAASKYSGTTIFKTIRDKVNFKKAVEEEARINTQNLGNKVEELLSNGELFKQLDRRGVGSREKLMRTIHDFTSSGGMKGKYIDEVVEDVKLGGQKTYNELYNKQTLGTITDAERQILGQFKKTGKSKYVPLTKEEIFNSRTFKESNLPKSIIPNMITIRNHIDDLSNTMLKTPGIEQVASKEFLDTVSANIGEYITRRYKAFDPNKKISEDYIAKLYTTPEGLKTIERAKAVVNAKYKNQFGTMVGGTKNAAGKLVGGRFVPYDNEAARLMDDEITKILYSGGEFEKLGNGLERLVTIDKGITKARTQVPKAIRDLLGEVKNIDEAYINSVRKMNDFSTSTKFYNDVLANGNGRYFFDKPTISEGGLKFTTRIDSDNALNTFYTTPQLANTLGELASNNNNRFLNSPIWNTFFLAPKAFSQESLTTMNPFTHVRNVISATSFTGMNGNWFRDPRKIATEFSDTLNIIKGEYKSNLETELGKRIYKDKKSLGEIDAYVKNVRELQELGVINNSPRLQEMAGLVDDVSKTFEKSDTVTPESVLYKIFKGFDPSSKSTLSKTRRVARNLYATEDNFFKVQNYRAEQSKYKEVWDDFYKNDVNGFVRKYGDEASKFGVSREDLFTQRGYDRFIKEKSADIVKNNIPNYDYVGDFIKQLRRLPLGNFVAFPVETIRTGINTLKQGVKEIGDPMTAGIGTKRILGVTAFGGLMGQGAVELGQLAGGVSDKTLNALKEYLPDWSKNSHIVPIKQGGQLYFIDFSHSNAYDLLTRPARAAVGAFNRSREDEETILKNVEEAGWEAIKELAQPFLSESIITEWFGDVWFRGGEKKNGKRIWQENDNALLAWTKGVVSLFSRAAPLGYKQMERVYLSGVGNKDQYNRGYKFMNEGLGILGFRIQDPFIEQGLSFKINDQKRKETQAKKEISSVAYNGNSTPEDVIKAYNRANEIKFEADKALFKRIEAAKYLGLSDKIIRKELRDRYSKKDASALIRGNFSPLKLSSFAIKTVKKNHLIRGLEDPSRLLRQLSKEVFNTYKGNVFFEDVESLFERPLDLMDDRTPNLVVPEGETVAPPVINTPTVPSGGGNILLDQFNSSQVTQPPSNVINQSDVSQLAKSGNIDITEAIAERRT